MRAQLPSALTQLDAIRAASAGRSRVIFLDYDGTLTPIVSRPEDAVLTGQMRSVLVELVQRGPVAIVSGRGLQDVRAKVDLEALYYAGSHGFEIAGPGGLHEIYQPAEVFLADLDQAELALRRNITTRRGTQVERKPFSIAVHYRHVDDENIPSILAAVEAVQGDYPKLRRTGGKCVVELRPDLAWHKGTVLFWLIERMGLTRADMFPIYLGDDVTDEDAFVALKQDGIGILVSETPCETAAQYCLANPDEVYDFLMALSYD